MKQIYKILNRFRFLTKLLIQRRLGFEFLLKIESY